MSIIFTRYSLLNKRSFSNLALLLSFLLLQPVSLFSQSTLTLNVINQGVAIRNTNDSVVIFGNVIHDGMSGVDGIIENDGHIYLSGDWTNNNTTGGIFSPGHAGYLHLDSSSQTINGTTDTYFNNLVLSGSYNSIKYLVGIDARIEDTLMLNEHEFDGADNTIFILNTDTNAITRSHGFVSNTDDGGLARTVTYKSNYFYPVGGRINGDTIRFRPVDIAPSLADSTNVYKIRMANVDPTDETYDRSTKDLPVGDINPFFYHRITRLSGNTPADITIYYDSINDLDSKPDYDIIAYWDTDPSVTTQWYNPGLGERIPYAHVDTNSLLSGLLKTSFNDFNDSITSTPIALSHNVDLKGDIFVANVFSPNGDGFNDFVFARARGLAEIRFVIYDRWGEKVFETTDLTTGWDGTYRGKLLNTGVYVYVIQGKFKSGDEVTQKGNVTLLR